VSGTTVSRGPRGTSDAAVPGTETPGTDDMIKKYIFAVSFAKIGVFIINKAIVCKKLIITMVFEKNANFFALESILHVNIGRNIFGRIFRPEF
jgi:hypothetical protein